MEKPKKLKELEKLFEEKFPNIFLQSYLHQNGLEYPVGGEVKQFWLEHIKTLLESVRMENNRQLLYRLVDKLIINQRAVDRGDITPYDRDGMDLRLYEEFEKEANQKIQFLLSG